MSSEALAVLAGAAFFGSGASSSSSASGAACSFAALMPWMTRNRKRSFDSPSSSDRRRTKNGVHSRR